MGADGAHSSVRKALKLDFEGVTYPGVPILAEVKLQGPVVPDCSTGVLSGRVSGVPGMAWHGIKTAALFT